MKPVREHATSNGQTRRSACTKAQVCDLGVAPQGLKPGAFAERHAARLKAVPFQIVTTVGFERARLQGVVSGTGKCAALAAEVER
jgi:hypothetical protein